MKRLEFHYRIDDKKQLTERAAECLSQLAEQNPGGFIAYNLLYKAVIGQKVTPKLKSQEVEGLRKKMHRIKQILREQYNRELVSAPGVGVRATTGDVDKLEKVVPKRVMVFEKARARLVNVTESIELKNVPVGHPMRKYLQTRVQPLLEKVTSEGFIKATQAALPSGDESAEQKKGDEQAPVIAKVG